MFVADPLGDAALRGLLLGVLALCWVILLIRLIGARTLSKMSPFDFVVTLATGSLLASAAAAAKLSAFLQAIAAMTVLLTAQYLFAQARQRSDRFKHLIENEPLLLMRDGAFIDAALRRSRVSRADILAKLREADISDIADVAAIVLETTGDISILTNPPAKAVLAGIRGVEAQPGGVGPARTPHGGD